MTNFEVDWPARPGSDSEIPDLPGGQLRVLLRDGTVNTATIRDVSGSRITLIDIWTDNANLSAEDIADRAD